MEVGTIVASDVVVATTIAVSGDTPKFWNRKNKTGTMTMPPPTPNSPAKVPAKAPTAIKANRVRKLSTRNEMRFTNGCFNGIKSFSVFKDEVGYYFIQFLDLFLHSDNTEIFSSVRHYYLDVVDIKPLRPSLSD